ncbi:MAG: hydrogenase nickel incorporation protein HypB [Chloroflexi bacterium]|nr:hydrogenase nickel incorporation protein HypB [Chloroflexota bacterium]
MAKKKIPIKEKVRKGNEEYAKENCRILAGKDILCINLMSSPGAGKTTLIEVTREFFGDDYRIAVIEGDLAGNIDEKRLMKSGIPVVQINTVSMCHLNAYMVNEVLEDLPLDDADFIFIENIGNLVCPAGVPLGEDVRVVILAITEGDDKPAKYPVIFHDADAVVINKIDFLRFMDVDVASIEEQIKAINPDASIFKVSAINGDGIGEWADWLAMKKKEKA